jgi:hypothetical protein
MSTLTSHPLERVLNLENGSSTELYDAQSVAEIAIECDSLPSQYDVGDGEIHDQTQQIYRLALKAFQDQNDSVVTLEGKYKSRAAEVAAQFLTIALNAVGEKSKLKQHKDKIKKAELEIETNAVISMDRNHLLRAILQESKDTAIDAVRTDTSE